MTAGMLRLATIVCDIVASPLLSYMEVFLLGIVCRRDKSILDMVLW